MLLTAFPNIAKPNAKILILGSMPGQKSLDENQYYAHPRNTFWKIMASIFKFDISLDYETRCEELTNNKVALWDVMQNCERPGSLDSAIVNATIIPNDFNAFFKTYKNIELIGFNGQKAAQTFKTKVSKTLEFDIKSVTLPSTSPAHASMSFEEKLEIWSNTLSFRA